jgi:tRNA modification GTPase
MLYDPNDTICAIATAPSGAARGMVRLSGSRSIAVASHVFQSHSCAPLEELRQPSAVRGEIQANHNGALRRLPCDLFVWPTHRSYTREPVVELHTFGSPPVLEAIITEICACGARLAEPGEFTMRAFLAGRIDLTQAEAVLGVIDARAATDLSTALTQMAGGLSKPFQHLRDELLQLLAELEAGLDFVEEDIEFVSQEETVQRLQSGAQMLAQIANQMASRHAGISDKQIVLLGKPNAGKSSLFNALVKRYGCRAGTDQIQPSAALVSPHRGTTRDYLIATVSLGEISCEIVDTAGIDETTNNDADSAAADSPSSRNNPTTEIAAASKALAERRRASATVRVLCVEANADCGSDASSVATQSTNYDVLVVTKGDLLWHPDRLPHPLPNRPLVVTSSLRGTGLDELCIILRSILTSERTAQRGQAVAATANRCRESIHLAEGSLTRAMELASAEMGHELVAVELRAALHELGKVVGTVYTDDLLDRIFSTFCIGK